MKKVSLLLMVLTGVVLFGSSVVMAVDNSDTKVPQTNMDKLEEKTSSVADKAIEATKSAAKKTAEGTKNITIKTVESTIDFLEDISMSGDVTVENLEKQASIKKLKYEKRALKSEYNSRIKDIKAKMKATEKSTMISDVQRQNKIYQYEKQILDLEQKRDSAMKKYDARIKDLKDKKN